MEKSATSTNIPQILTKKADSDVELQTVKQSKTSDIDDGEEYEFRWQEKVFSQV